ncbi:MAG: aminopeptidase P family protein [Rhodospirillaceae bacterium]|nr:aminopeptidase P family protein [Rhodospirillaceae bacterium]
MTSPASPERSAGRVAALRALLAQDGLQGFVVPRADEHQGEYVPPGAERLAWLTGFTGSAGLAIVLAEKAAIFVDGRYTLQVGDQIDPAVFEVRHITDQPAAAWLRESLSGGGRLGYDPWLHTADGAARLRAACEAVGAELAPVAENPIDRLWQDRPSRPDAPFEIHPPELAGETSAGKRAALANKLAERGVEAAVLTLPDSIAWLLNIRGRDVPRTPFPLSFAVLRNDATVALFAPAGKIDAALAGHLGDGVSVEPPDAFEAALGGFAGRKVLADPASAADRIFRVLDEAGALVERGADPCQMPKACKNAVELEGARNAHRRDGAALTRFLAWLAREAPGGAVDEIAAADRLEGFRRESNLLRDLSFDTISGAGPNGAIVHYRVTPETNRRLEPGALYLVDSGGQYADGTTDVTRTVAIGAPTAAMRRHFTLVLKGHIALATARFPEGTTGSQIDALARLALWADGLDYDHGTGHGVGSYLSVHEGPQRISKLPNSVALKPGMIVSNEPGYYRTGEYGIRIENLVAVQEVEVAGAERPMLGFETLTLAPIDRALIDRALLTADETGWVDGYHARVRETIGPLVDPDTAAWLEEATRPL